MERYDDMLPVSLVNDRNREQYVLLDRHNDVLAYFEQSRDDHECQKIVEAINAQATVEALQRERDALKLVNETHMKTVMKLSHIVEQSGAALDAERDRLVKFAKSVGHPQWCKGFMTRDAELCSCGWYVIFPAALTPAGAGGGVEGQYGRFAEAHGP